MSVQVILVRKENLLLFISKTIYFEIVKFQRELMKVQKISEVCDLRNNEILKQLGSSIFSRT